MKKFLFYSLLAISISCDNAQKIPNKETIQKSIEKRIGKWSKNKVKLIRFEKLNGLEQEVFGIKAYSVDYNGKIEYLKNGFLCQYPSKNLFRLDEKTTLDKFYYFKIKKGKTLNIKGEAVFIRKENGWELDRLSANQSQ